VLGSFSREAFVALPRNTCSLAGFISMLFISVLIAFTALSHLLILVLFTFL